MSLPLSSPHPPPLPSLSIVLLESGVLSKLLHSHLDTHSHLTHSQPHSQPFAEASRGSYATPPCSQHTSPPPPPYNHSTNTSLPCLQHISIYGCQTIRLRVPPSHSSDSASHPFPFSSFLHSPPPWWAYYQPHSLSPPLPHPTLCGREEGDFLLADLRNARHHRHPPQLYPFPVHPTHPRLPLSLSTYDNKNKATKKRKRVPLPT